MAARRKGQREQRQKCEADEREALLTLPPPPESDQACRVLPELVLLLRKRLSSSWARTDPSSGL